MTTTTVTTPDCTCPPEHDNPGMVPATFQVFTDARGMIVLRAVDSDGQPVAELAMCPDEAFGVALALGANAELAPGPVPGRPRPGSRGSRPRLKGRG